MVCKFSPMESPSTQRRMAAAMWRHPNNPAIVGHMDVDASRVLKYINEYQERHGIKLTLTNLVTRALAINLKAHPEYNAKVRWGRLLVRDSVDIFLLVATEGGKDLAGVKLHNVDTMSLKEIATKTTSDVDNVRKGSDRSYAKSRGMIKRLPPLILSIFLKISDFLVNSLHLHLPGFGMPRDPFGSAMITNVGMFGIDVGYAPFTPIARTPVILLLTQIKDTPWVEDGKLVVRPVFKICATFDHRILDGYQIGVMASEVKQLLMNPESLELEEDRKK